MASHTKGAIDVLSILITVKLEKVYGLYRPIFSVAASIFSSTSGKNESS